MSAEGARWPSVIAAVLVALAATLPFLKKAFHIDDVLYLAVAGQITETPWDPYGESLEPRAMVLWDAENGLPASLFETDYNPPLWKYALAGTIAWWGREEWKTHLVASVFVVGGAIALVLISRRLTSWSLWCVIMILWSPFFLPGQNAMLEVPVLFLASWSAVCMWRAWETGRAWPALAAGVFVGLAVLTKYTCALLAPIYIFGAWQRGNKRSLWFLLPTVAIVGAWMLHNDILYGKQHITSHGLVFKPFEWPARALTVLRIIGGVSFLGPIWWVKLYRMGRSGRLALLAVLTASLVLGWLDMLQARGTLQGWKLDLLPVQRAHFVFFTSLGSATILSWLAATALEARADFGSWRRDSSARTLDFWLAALLAFNVACVPFNAVRHLLLAFVPLTWLSARQLRTGSGPLALGTMAATVLLGWALAAADYEIAGLYREVAQTHIRRDIASHRRVWFQGHWGWFYYAVREGALPYFDGTEVYLHDRVRPGDRIYYPHLVNWKAFDPKDNRCVWVEHLQPVGVIPIRTIQSGAHYYGVLTHILPWQLLIKENETAQVEGGYRILALDDIQVFDVLRPPASGRP